MTPHDDAPAERDELRGRLMKMAESRRMDPWAPEGRPVCVMCGGDWLDDGHKADCWVPTLFKAAALLAPQDAREPEQTAWREAFDRLLAVYVTAARAAFRGAEFWQAYMDAERALHDHIDVLAASRPAPETREPELLGYVVERQRTPGEWVRVWRGSTLWFDHDEAVLERDAYALDGIPARIRGVYLGAPAPAEARQVLALDAIRDVLGIDYDEDDAVWLVSMEPEPPIECATLDDALRAYAKMAAPAEATERSES